MKAKVIKTGRIIEVDKAMIGYAECATANIDGSPMQNFYSKNELEFLPDTADKVIEGWLCKEKDIEDTVMLHEDEPHLEWQPLSDSYSYESYGKVYWLPDIFSPDLTYENSPKRVKITITPME